MSVATSNLERFPDLHPAFNAQGALVEASRCLYCFDAPCTAACPTHIDVPRFIKKISTGNLRGSALTILDANILGLSCSRVCPVGVLCEGACVMHRYNEKPIEIGRLQRFAMERFYDNGAILPAAATHRAEKVACVGAGPASLSCAAALRQHGVDVTIFEQKSLAGGLNTYGVAEYKLHVGDSLREVEFIRGMGVKFVQLAIGESAPLEQLEKEYDFIFLGMGLGAMNRMGIPGEDLPGVVNALTFISDYKTRGNPLAGNRVVVIGGGNTAIDAANAARRLGAADVSVIYRRTEQEMPAFDFEYEHSKIEGVRFHWLSQPVALHAGKDNRVGSVECIRMEMGEPDSSGRRSPRPVPGSNFDIDCDMVIPSLGQGRFTRLIEARPGIVIRDGSVVVERASGRTGNPKYYAGGDCVNGGREVVDAAADGKRAALAMLNRDGQGAA
jgi:dihydropyrimidine dehydrogenase (NAD+) subunit PreT